MTASKRKGSQKRPPRRSKKAARKPKPRATTAKSKTFRTIAEVAEYYGVSHTTVRQSWKVRGMPALPCELEKMEAWRQTLRSAPKESRGETSATEARTAKMVADAEKAQASAIITRHRAEQMSRSLVSLEAVERFLSSFLAETRRLFVRIPEEVKTGYPNEWREQLGEDLAARIDMALQACHGHAETLVELRDDK